MGNNFNDSKKGNHNEVFTEKDFALVPAERINEVADMKGHDFSQKINTNQIRNFFSHFNTLRNEFKQRKITKMEFQELDASLILIKPKLAYAKGRNRKVEDFKELMFEVIDKVYKSNNKEKAYENFFEFVEAIVAYHKYYGGKD